MHKVRKRHVERHATIHRMGDRSESKLKGVPMCSIFEPGKYACACCNSELFDASEKFDSRSGWPSFTQPIEFNRVAYHNDGSHGMNRIEALCNSCDAHLGHVFPDGPEPSGLRYCINALSLKKNK